MCTCVLNRETSDLVFCVADLQLNNQKLQEEVRKLKQATESMEETNQKLIEENEELKSQARMYARYLYCHLVTIKSYSYDFPSVLSFRGQQLLQKEKMLKEEVEEMKLSLTSSEESRAQASAQRKQMVRTFVISVIVEITCIWFALALMIIRKPRN